MEKTNELTAASIPELVAMWGIQDTLLQQYRTIFITMQSIFIAVATTVVQSDVPWISMGLLTVLAGVTLWLWVTICSKRGKAVYLLQYLGLRAEQGFEVFRPLKTLKDFQDGKHPEIDRDEMFRALEGGRTRKKLEVVLPGVFVMAWIFLWMILVLQHYNVLFIQR